MKFQNFVMILIKNYFLNFKNNFKENAKVNTSRKIWIHKTCDKKGGSTKLSDISTVEDCVKKYTL